MNEWYMSAKKKLETERKSGKYDRYAAVMKDAVCDALDGFCRQDGEFAQAVVQGGTFEDCMKAVAAARREAEAEAKKRIREATEKAQEQARKTAVQQIAEEREKAASQARTQQEAADRAALEEARRREAEAMQRAEETAKQLQLASDKDSARFALLFDDLQAKATAMVELAEEMRAKGKVEQAEKFMGALKRALEALRENLEGEGE